MHWLAGVLGGFLGAMIGAADRASLGLVLGFLVGWQGVRLLELRRRVESLERNAGVRVAAQEQDDRTTAPPAWGEPQSPAWPSTAQESAASQPIPRAVPPRPEPAQAEPAPVHASVRAPDEFPAAGSDWAARVGATLKRWFLEGNVPVKLGSLVLLIGAAAALRYATDRGLLRFPIEFRLAGIALAALALIGWGWRRRGVQPAFGLSLQGAGLGVLLLTAFAAYRLYDLLPSGAAFALVLVVVAAAAALALLQNAAALAVIGFVGGYLAPVLLSSGGGSHVALFAYYTVLNAAVLAIAWVRPWRALNLVGFAFTFAVMALWGWRFYRPENFASVEPFLILFFLFYTAIPILYALRQPPQRRGLVDGTLVFGTPLLAFPMQVALLPDEPMALAYSALAMAALYALLATWLIRSRGIALLGQSFAVLAVGFATLAVPLALSMRWTSATWALEGAALVWLGLRQQRLLPQLAGWALQGLAALAYVAALAEGAWNVGEDEPWAINGHTLGLLMMAGAGLFIARLYDRAAHPRRWLVWPPFLAGWSWWFVAGVREIAERMRGNDEVPALAGFAALTLVVAAMLRRHTAWPRPGWIVVALCALCVPLAALTLQPRTGLLDWPQTVAWLLLFAAMALALRGLADPRQRGIGLAHAGALWTLALALGVGLFRQARDADAWALGEGWQIVALGLPLAGLLLGSWRHPHRFGWPLAARFPEHARGWWLSASLVLALGFVHSLASAGDPDPLPFVPLINPLELLQLTVLVMLIRHSLSLDVGSDLRRALQVLLPLAAFLFLSFAGLRGVHHLTGVDWTPALLFDATAQATLTVLWSVAGVIAWIIGSRLQRWPIWIAGAALMGLVLLKLIAVDRRYMGDLAGIVSFLAVGGLLVVVGRIAPTPPRGTGERS